MKKLISDFFALCAIGVFLWVSYWMAAVIETGIPMPKHIFVIAIAVYGSIIVGLIAALCVGVIRLVWGRRILQQGNRGRDAVYINGSGELYTKK